MTLSVALIITIPVCAGNLISAANAAEIEQSTQQTPAITDQTTEPATDKQSPEETAALNAKKVKTFKIAIIKKNYGIYQGNFENKISSAKYFHKTFNVNRTYTRDGKKYYLISKKGEEPIGYINKKAVATPNQAKIVDTPYVSQYVPVKAPWGCAGASMAMLLGSQGQKINANFLKKVQDNLPMQPTKGGQKGNVYTGAGFGYVIKPSALAKYARTFKTGKNVINISNKKLTLNDIRMYVQGGKPVLYYGFSSYQKPGDNVRNHCKVIVGYEKGEFLVYDPLYYSKHDRSGSGGKNMNYDHGAIAWLPKSTIQAEFDHKALTIN